MFYRSISRFSDDDVTKAVTSSAGGPYATGQDGGVFLLTLTKKNKKIGVSYNSRNTAFH